MDEAKLLLRALLVIIVIGQIGSFVLALKRNYSLASLLNGASPLLVLYFAWAKSGPWGSLSWFEISFLLMEVLTFVLSTGALWIVRGVVPLFWIGWVLNFFACAAIVYLAFFFSIQF